MVEPAAKKPRSGEAEAAAPVKATAKKGPARGGSGVNGASKAGGSTKGKTRADPPPKTNGTSGEAMEVDHEDVVEVDEDEPPDPPVQRGNRSGGKQTKVRSGAATAAVGRPSKTEERLAREVERLRAQLDQARESSKEVRSHIIHPRTPFRTYVPSLPSCITVCSLSSCVPDRCTARSTGGAVRRGLSCSPHRSRTSSIGLQGTLRREHEALVDTFR